MCRSRTLGLWPTRLTVLELGPNWGWHALPLIWAACEGDVNLVQRLLACGADSSLRGKSDRLALGLAEFSNGNFTGGEYGSALCAAAFKDKSKVVLTLLEHGVNPDLEGESSPLLKGHQSYN